MKRSLDIPTEDVIPGMTVLHTWSTNAISTIHLEFDGSPLWLFCTCKKWKGNVIDLGHADTQLFIHLQNHWVDCFARKMNAYLWPRPPIAGTHWVYWSHPDQWDVTSWDLVSSSGVEATMYLTKQLGSMYQASDIMYKSQPGLTLSQEKLYNTLCRGIDTHQTEPCSRCREPIRERVYQPLIGSPEKFFGCMC